MNLFCPACPDGHASFTTLSDLEDHVVDVHYSSSSLFRCATCKKSGTHMRTSCEVFLLRHYRSIHPDEYDVSVIRGSEYYTLKGADVDMQISVKQILEDAVISLSSVVPPARLQENSPSNYASLSRSSGVLASSSLQVHCINQNMVTAKATNKVHLSNVEVLGVKRETMPTAETAKHCQTDLLPTNSSAADALLCPSINGISWQPIEIDPAYSATPEVKNEVQQSATGQIQQEISASPKKRQKLNKAAFSRNLIEQDSDDEIEILWHVQKNAPSPSAQAVKRKTIIQSTPTSSQNFITKTQTVGSTSVPAVIKETVTPKKEAREVDIGFNNDEKEILYGKESRDKCFKSLLDNQESAPQFDSEKNILLETASIRPKTMSIRAEVPFRNFPRPAEDMQFPVPAELPCTPQTPASPIPPPPPADLIENLKTNSSTALTQSPIQPKQETPNTKERRNAVKTVKTVNQSCVQKNNQSNMMEGEIICTSDDEIQLLLPKSTPCSSVQAFNSSDLVCSTPSTNEGIQKSSQSSTDSTKPPKTLWCSKPKVVVFLDGCSQDAPSPLQHSKSERVASPPATLEQELEDGELIERQQPTQQLETDSFREEDYYNSFDRESSADRQFQEPQIVIVANSEESVDVQNNQGALLRPCLVGGSGGVFTGRMKRVSFKEKMVELIPREEQEDGASQSKEDVNNKTNQTHKGKKNNLKAGKKRYKLPISSDESSE